MAYTDTMNGITYHLVIHQAFEISHLDHHLIWSMQCHVNGVMINDTPEIITNEPTPQTHAIVINIKDCGAENDNIILPLSMKGLT